MDFVLPKALIDSEDFVDLLPGQQDKFAQRLLFAQCVLKEAWCWFELEEGEFWDFVDGLELDLVSATSVDLGDTKTQVSSWFVHSAWGMGIREEPLTNFLHDETKKRLDESLPGLSVTQSEFADWLLAELKASLLVFDGLKDSRTFAHALGHLVAIDIFLGRLLVALYKWRLWAMR